MYKMEYHPAIKRNKPEPFTDTVIQCDIRKRKRTTNTHMWNPENGTNEPICKAEVETQASRTNLWTEKGERGSWG